MSTLGQRAVACKGWRFRWMPGMRTTTGHRVLLDLPLGKSNLGRLPDLDDPATRGCLLALVREAWGPDHYVTISPATPYAGNKWEVSIEDYYGNTVAVFVSATEAEVLVAALEAAPDNQ